LFIEGLNTVVKKVYFALRNKASCSKYQGMKVRLSEIDQEGKTYELSRQSGELNEILQDLISGDYKVEVLIRDREA
jgi:hypothetical protein